MATSLALELRRVTAEGDLDTLLIGLVAPCIVPESERLLGPSQQMPR